MVNWELYEKRLNVNGDTQRERTINLAKHNISKGAISSPDCKDVLISDIPRKIMVASTKEDNKKRIQTLPYETISMGELVIWNEMHWMVNSIDFDDEIYRSGTIVQCNRIIGWQNPITLEIIERWCFCSKPYTSNIDEGNVVSTLKGKYDIQIPYDSETIQVGVDKRLMLDIVGGKPMVYKLTFPDTNTNKIQDIDGGFIEWTVVSDAYVQERDNVGLMICDYIDPGAPPKPPEPPVGDLLKCEITGRSDIRIGGSPRQYKAKFYAADGVTEVKDGISPIWELIAPTSNESYYKLLLSNENFVASVSAEANDALVGDVVILRLIDEDKKYQKAEIRIEVSSI